MNRLPRKLKKGLKKKYKQRYGINFLKCDNLLVEYIWFYKNAFNWNMNKKLRK